MAERRSLKPNVGGSNPPSSSMSYIEQLYKDFPNAMSNVYCGAFIGKGWIEPVRNALKVLDAAGAKVVQIKEKFGGLRLYYNHAKDINVWAYVACEMAVRDAEQKCWKLCENCGAKGKLRDGGWVKTLCDACDKK